MSRRDTDRERDSRRAAASVRTNEYFVPKDGIDREVITADICRYLGNDALVRPGTYEDRETRVAIPGYFITAYRNLTTAMIADLKADSSRWDDERSRPGGQPSNVGYRDSTTHQSRQYYGPTEAAVATPTGGYPPSSAAGGAPPQEVYSQGYGPGQNYGQNNPAYGGPSAGYGGPHQPDGGNYYVAGAAYGNLNHQPSSEPDPRGGRNGPLPPAQSVPRGGAGYPSQAPTSYPESRGNAGGYYAPPGPGGQAPSQYPPHPGDAYYGRQSPAVAGYGDPADSYPDSRPYEQPQYSQGPMSSSTTATANQGAPRRGGGDRERDSDPRDRQHRPHGSSRPHGGRN